MTLPPRIARVFAILLLTVSGAHAAPKKNILFIAIDDLRPVMGCYGGGAVTPHMDAFAKTACLFERHYVQWPVCGSSRASLLSGQRPKTHGCFENVTSTAQVASRPDAPTLPFYLKQAGYNPLCFGKIYHSQQNLPGCGWARPPFFPDMPWQLYVDFKPSPGDPPRYQPAQEIYNGPDAEHGDYQIATQVVNALEDAGNKPFCIFAGLLKPHLPFVAPKKYWDLYRNLDIKPLEPTAFPFRGNRGCYQYTEMWDYGFESLSGKKRNYSEENPPDERQTVELTRAYYSCVSFEDAQVQRILRRLRELGLDKNTAVVIWGDHGFHLGDQERWSKGTQFEADLRAPLIIRLPGVTDKPVVSKALVETIDIYPTLLEYCGLPLPDSLEGESLIPVISGRQKTFKKSALSEMIPITGDPDINRRTHIYSLRGDDYRYVQWRDPKDISKVVSEELYDMRNSLGERRNLVTVAGHQGTLRDMRTLMKQEHPDY